MPQQVYPDFLSEFACKCGACRRTCCRDWEVRLSKQEFQASRSGKLDLQAHALAQKNLRRNPNRQNDGEYALCRMRPDGFCSFLTSDQLCAWRKLRGHGLCQACDDFPNTYISFLGDEYHFPSLSCEAVAELLLHRADPIQLAREELNAPRANFGTTIGQQNFVRRPLLALYPRLMEWGLGLLQDRRFPLDDRMVLLAHAMSLMDWMERNGRVDEIADAFESFLQLENLQQTLQKYARLTIGPQALLTVNGYTLSRLIDVPPYQAQARRVLSGLGIECAEGRENGSVSRRLKLADSQQYPARKLALADYFKQKQNFMEHVMVSEFLRGMVPFAAPSVWDSFKFFNVCYALLKGVLTGGFATAPSDDETVDAVVVLHRMFIHNYDAYGHTSALLDTIQLTDLTSMVALAKG